MQIDTRNIKLSTNLTPEPDSEQWDQILVRQVDLMTSAEILRVAYDDLSEHLNNDCMEEWERDCERAQQWVEDWMEKTDDPDMPPTDEYIWRRFNEYPPGYLNLEQAKVAVLRHYETEK